MAENTVFLLLTALIRNFYKTIIHRLEVKRFGLKATSPDFVIASPKNPHQRV